MKLKVRSFGFALGIFWALIVFCIGFVNLFFPTYGAPFLKMVDSIYPGYQYGNWGFAGVIVGTLYAALDGFIMGIIFAWLYNLFAKEK